MQEGIKVDRPTYPKDLGHEDMRCIPVPEGSTYPFDCREAKVIWNANNLAVPGSILGWPTYLVNYGCPDEYEKQCAPNDILRIEDLFPNHTFFPFPVQVTTRLTLRTSFRYLHRPKFIYRIRLVITQIYLVYSYN